MEVYSSLLHNLYHENDMKIIKLKIEIENETFHQESINYGKVWRLGLQR